MQNDGDRVGRQADLVKAEGALVHARALTEGDPNISGLGYGRRIRGGKITDELVATFFVKRKLSTDEEMVIFGTRRIPAAIGDGVGTDVVEMRPVASAGTGQRDKTSFNPLVGGPATSNADNHMAFWNWFGTLGTVCFDASDSTPLALSNFHVWVMDGGDSGDTIIQPGHPTAGDYTEAGAKLLLCGPLANLFDWNAPSPLTIGLWAAAAAAAEAAALSDAADPVRRGQLATAPASPAELTTQERVHVATDPVDDPLPGTSFRTGVKWAYERTTDAATYSHAVDEVQRNEHVLEYKQLWTDVEEYRGGQRVHLMAQIDTSRAIQADDYHLVAQLVSPKQDQKLSVVLHPTFCPREPRPVCVDFACDPIGVTLGGRYPRGSAIFLAPQGSDQIVVDRYPPGGDGRGELSLWDGHEVLIPPSREVIVELVPINGPITVEAFEGATRVTSVTTSLAPMSSQALVLAAPHGAIDRLVFSGGFKAALLLRLCYVRVPIQKQEGPAAATVGAAVERTAVVRSFCYAGSITLDPIAQIGCWKCYLYVQTVNNVSEGTDPVAAAGTIGGLPVAQNLTTQPVAEFAGCAIVMLLDHVFHVI